MKQSLLLLVLAVLVGCSEPAPDPKVEQDRLKSAQLIRSFYQKSGGDYSKLSPEDKAELLKTFNNKEEDAMKMWHLMSGQAVPGNRPAPTGG